MFLNYIQYNIVAKSWIGQDNLSPSLGRMELSRMSRIGTNNQELEQHEFSPFTLEKYFVA